MKCRGTATNNRTTATFPRASICLYIVRKEDANPIVSKRYLRTVDSFKHLRIGPCINITSFAMLYVNKSGNEKNRAF